MKFKNNFIVKFVVTLFLIGIIIGFLSYFFFKPDLKEHLESFKDLLLTTKQNTFLSSTILISAIFVLSISIIGAPVIAFYLFYEGLSIGFTFGLFLAFYNIKGLLFYILFLLSSKIIYLLIIGYFIIFSLRYIVRFIDAIINKNREELYKTIVFHFYRYLMVLGAILINCTLIYFLSNRLIMFFIDLI